MNKKFIGIITAASVFAACNQPMHKDGVKEDILAAHLDTTVSPKDDFFAYANNGWIKNNPIPADETAWGVGELVQKELYTKLRKINDDALARNDQKGTGKQIGDFWFSAMDTVSIEKNGVEPLREELNKIAAMQNKDDVMTQAAHMHVYGANVFFDEGVAQDPKHSDVWAYDMNQGGLGLPNRDYYFNTDERTVKIRSEYPGYIASIFRLMGADDKTAEAKAKAIIALETTLAKSSRKLEDLRDPYTNYHKIAIKNLGGISPGIEWPKYLSLMGVKYVDSVIVGQPEFYAALGKAIATTDMQTLKDYMSFHLVTTFAGYLSKPFADANFNFYGKTIHGAQEQHPRWRRALDAEEGAIGEALGQLFVKEYFDVTAKARYEIIVENVRNAYKSRIEKLTWMDDSTKQKAIHKLTAIRKKVGYPDKWKDFSAMKIDRGPYALNMLHANLWWNNYQMSKLGKRVDRDEWDMTPQTYNAYYN